MQIVHGPQAVARRIRLLGVGVMTLSLFGVGCAGMNHTEKGLLAGGLVGGVAGGVIGHALGNTAAGAVIGTGVGAIAGGAAGSHKDEKEHIQHVQTAQALRGGPLSLEKVAEMSRSGVGDGVIVEQIRLTGSRYNLTPDQIVWLKQSGVSDTVIHSMQSTGYGGGRRVVYEAAPPPVVVTQPVYIVEPPPPPPPAIGFGVSYTSGRRR